MAKVIITSVHEAWEENIAKTGHEFYTINSKERQDGWKSQERDRPSNFFDIEDLKGKADFIITNTFEQRGLGKMLKERHNATWIEMYHCFPYITWFEETISFIKYGFCADIAVFATIENSIKWGFNHNDKNVKICGHTASEVFQPNYKGDISQVLTVAYDFKERSDLLGFNDATQITGGFNWLHIGNEDFATLATRNELASYYYPRNLVYLNTAHHSPVPTSMLEAMACGMPVISVNTESNRRIFNNDFDNIIYKNAFDARNKIKKLMDNYEYRMECSRRSLDIFESKFSRGNFINNWKEILS